MPALLALIAVCSAVAAGLGWAFYQTSGTAVWKWLWLPYGVAAVATVISSWKAPGVWRQLKYRQGDLVFGAVAGGLALGMAWFVGGSVSSSQGSVNAWMFRILMSASGLSTSLGLLALLVLATMEEWVWRGWAQAKCELLVSARWAWCASAVLYSLVHVPTLWLLADPDAGLNPLLILAALGLGLLLGQLRKSTGRLLPGLFAHLVFTYFGATWLLPAGLPGLSP